MTRRAHHVMERRSQPRLDTGATLTSVAGLPLGPHAAAGGYFEGGGLASSVGSDGS